MNSAKNTNYEAKDTVVVMMSTYNGEKYIKEQIQSIIGQLGDNDSILIRDDGSKDDTLRVIESIADPRIQLIHGDNLGFAQSFLWLLYHVDDRHSVYMLADQDDIWCNGKIANASQYIKDSEEPRLYCSRLTLVDEELQVLGDSPSFRKAPSFQNAISENIATGCTIAINAAALNIIRRVDHSILEKQPIHYHDWWLYLNISYYGQVFWDETSRILYRQHGKNSVGMAPGLRRYWKIWQAIQKTSWVKIMILQLRTFVLTQQQSLPQNDKNWISKLCYGRPHEICYRLITDKHIIRQQTGHRFLFNMMVIYDFLRGQLKPI